jgi:beta-lactamase regulating signal transducer with metallopeptidase domain
METLFHTASVFSATAVSALFSAVWEGIVMAVCVAVCLRLLPGLSAAARSLVWLNVFLLVALLHLLPSLHFGSAVGNGAIGGIAGQAPIQLDLRWSLAIGALWGLLSLGRGVQLLVSAVRLRGLLRRATPIEPDAALQPLLQTQSWNGKPGRAAQLCTSTEIERPSVFGFFRPRILLPPELLHELSASELQQVVIHEMEHLRRGDDWTNLLQKICLILFPINPVLLWVERRLCAERELACDDSVLRSSCGRKAYALCLTHLAEHSMLRRGFTLVLGAWERQSELVRRVHRILRRPADAMSARKASLVTAGLVIAVLGVATGLARSPQLVSFAAPVIAAPIVANPSGANPAQPALQASSSQPSGLRDSSFRPAKFTQSQFIQEQPTAQMVKAIMPEHPAQQATARKAARVNISSRMARPRFFERQQTFVVLTEWNDSEIPPHIVFAVAPNNRIAYAAVPVADGWLIVQI